MTGEEFGQGTSPGEIRQKAFEFWQQHLRGKAFQNADTGKEIRISRDGIQKLLSFSGDIRRAQLVPRIPELLADASYSFSEAPHKAKAKYWRYHHFLADTLLAGKEHEVHLIVGEDANGNWLYEFADVKEVEKPAPNQGPRSGAPSSLPANGGLSNRSIGPDGGEVKRNSREDYRAAAPDHQPGWRTVGGGAHVYIGKDGRIEAGCPGLKTEDVGEIGEEESPQNRQQREHRMDVAEHHGLGR